MKKFIATLAAAALAIAGAVVVAPSVQADHPWEWNYSNLASVDEYNGAEACTPKSNIIIIPEENRDDEEAWVADQVHNVFAPQGCDDGRTVTLTLVEGGGCAGSYTVCFRNYSSDPLGNTYRVKSDFGVENIYIELVSGTFNFEECRTFGRAYAEDKYGPLMPWFKSSGIAQPGVCSVGFEIEPQVDEDCADDQLLVPVTSATYGGYNMCVTAPVAVSGGKEDKQLNAIQYDGIVGDDWNLFEICPSEDYIGSWMQLQNNQSWTDWYLSLIHI